MAAQTLLTLATGRSAVSAAADGIAPACSATRSGTYTARRLSTSTACTLRGSAASTYRWRSACAVGQEREVRT